MAKKCSVCDKAPKSANNVSHAKNRTKTRNKPNLKNVRIIKDGTISRVWVCTRCLRSNKVKKAA
jgi:large subunit ribosomal protein L28